MKWVAGCERGWRTAAKQVVLWQRLGAACAQHRVEWF